jgi:hypothetical protein
MDETSGLISLGPNPKTPKRQNIEIQQIKFLINLRSDIKLNLIWLKLANLNDVLVY